MRKCAIISCMNLAQNCRCNLGQYCKSHGQHSTKSFDDVLREHAETQALKIMEDIENKIIKGPYEK